MKKIACSLVTALLMGLSVNTFAQKSMAIFNTATAQKIVDEKTVVVTFDLDNITDASAKQKFHTSFERAEGVRQVASTAQPGNKAAYTLTMYKRGHNAKLQDALVAAGIEELSVDGKVISSKELVRYVKEYKKANEKK